MKAAKFRELSREELGQQCADLERELQALCVRKSATRIEQPSRIRALRRDVARAKTIMRERRNA
jgi:large subunit ribosomal protein L29